MGPDFSGGDPDFEFAFDSSNFSDRVLRIEIVEEEDRRQGDREGGCESIAEWTNRKRRREEITKESVSEFTECEVELALGYNQLESVDYAGGDNENIDVMEQHLLGVEATKSSGPSCTAYHSASLKVRSIHISSPILAAKSPFFYKLFSNSIMDLDLRQATLRIFASEEAALMELLRYMYSGKLSTTSISALLDVLMSADKYEVASCVRHCSQLLRNLPMTPESALLYLELPYSVSLASEVQPLTDAAKEYLANRYKDIAKCQDEVMKLPLTGLEAILCNDGLQVTSEDALYDFVLKWARTWYPKLEERREILRTRLCPLIRFPYMTSRKLKKVLACNDLDHDVASKVVLEGLFFKAEAPHRQRALGLEDSFNRRFSERAYKYRPLKILQFDVPQQQCIVYLDLKREECSSLFPSNRIYSQAFHLCGQGFFLSAHCSMDQQNLFHCFGFFLGMQDKGTVSLTVDYEFAVRTTDTKEFVNKYRGYYTFTGGKAVGYRNIFGIPWKSFMADDSLYFVNDVLHLRAELTVKQPQSKVQKLV